MSFVLPENRCVAGPEQPEQRLQDIGEGILRKGYAAGFVSRGPGQVVCSLTFITPVATLGQGG